MQLFNLARVVPLMLANASSAIFAFSAGPIFRLVLCVILRSACCEGNGAKSISQPVRFSGSTSAGDSQISINRAMVSLTLPTIVDPHIQQPYPAAKKKYEPEISRSIIVDCPAH